MEQQIQQFGDYKQGLRLYDDQTSAPLGSAMEMINAVITDRGGISKRKGIELLGDFNTSTDACSGFFVFKKSDGTTDIPMRFYGTTLQYYSPKTLAWETLKTGYTAGTNFGFTNGLPRTGYVDYCYFGNKYEDDSRWSGVTTQLKATLSSLDTTIVVDDIFRADIYWTGTASANSTTTLDITSTTEWVADQWNGNFYVQITSGTYSGYVRKITDGTSTQITFDALPAAPGNCTFNIRCTDFTATGSLVIDGQIIPYTGIDKIDTFTAPIFDQSQASQDGSTAVGEADLTTKYNKICQSFTAATTSINGVRLYKKADTGTFTGTVTVELYADSGGSPTGSALKTKTFTNVQWLALPVGEFEVLYSSSYTSVASTLYWIVVSCSTADNSNHPNLGRLAAGGLANGSVKFWNTTDGYAAIATIDLYIKTLTNSTVTGTIAVDKAVCQSVLETPGNPKGNRHELLNGRRYVANVKSGLARDTSGNLGGASNLGSVYVSKVVSALYPTNDLNVFSYSNPRAAGEGDIISSVYGGYGHIDVAAYNKAMYMFKPNAIESVQYSQDEKDYPLIEQISGAYGSKMRVVKAQDDVYFVTSDNQFTSLGLVAQRGADNVQALNLGLPVKRLLETYDFDANAKGESFKNRVFIPAKSSTSDSYTNRVLVYNLSASKDTGYFEGEWWLNVDGMDVYNKDLYFSSSINGNVYKLYGGLNDNIGTSGDATYEYPIVFKWKSNFINLASSKFMQQEANLFACEGYIRPGTTLTFKLYKNFNTSPFLNFDFQGTETALVDNTIQSAFLGSLPKGIEPLGAIGGEIDNEGRRHFMFLIYFPFEQAEYVSYSIENDEKSADFEILRAGMAITEGTALNFASRIKNL